MGEPAGALFLVCLGPVGSGHEAEGPVVVDPGAGLVGLFQAAQLVGGVGVHPAVAVLARLG